MRARASGIEWRVLWWVLPAIVIVLFVLTGAAAVVPGVAGAASSLETVWISQPLSGAQQELGSGQAEVSGDGRVVAFASSASNLVAGDTNGTTDVFVRRVDGTGGTELVSVAPNGTQFALGAGAPAISGDGRFVVFLGNDGISDGGDGQSVDLYLRDRVAGTTERVGTGGSVQLPSISADGRTVAFFTHEAILSSDVNSNYDLYAYDRVTHTYRVVSTGVVEFSIQPALSADGTTIAYVSGQFTKGFVLATVDGSEEVSVSADGERVSVGLLSLSGDGRKVVFTGGGTNVIGDSPCADRPFDGACPDVFVYDRGSGAVELVSVDSQEVRSRRDSFSGRISADGRYVAFWSEGSLDPASPGGIYVRDLEAGTTTGWAVSTSGALVNGQTSEPSISDHGETVTFQTTATNLDSRDTAICQQLPSQLPVACVDVYARTSLAAPPPPPPAPPSGGGGGGGGGGSSGSADLGLEGYAQPVTAAVGDEVTYYLRVSDVNFGTALGVNVDVELPAGVQLVSTYAERGPGCGGVPLVCNLDWMSSDAPYASITIKTKVATPGQLTFKASVRYGAADAKPENNTVSIIVNKLVTSPFTPLVPPETTLPPTTKTGTAGPNTLRGSARADTLRGLGGNDSLYGLAGNDRLFGGSGNDRLFGGTGRDLLDGGTGNDVISARDRNRDTIRCGAGRDTVTADRIDAVARDCETVNRR